MVTCLFPAGKVVPPERPLPWSSLVVQFLAQVFVYSFGSSPSSKSSWKAQMTQSWLRVRV